MNIPISRRMKKGIKMVTSDNEYVHDLEKRQQYLQSITDCIQSPFGVLLLNALETIECSALDALYESKLKCTEDRARAEIKVSRYMKATIMAYVQEQDALTAAIVHYNEMEQGELQND